MAAPKVPNDHGLYAFRTVHLGVLGPLEVSGPTGDVALTGRNDRVVLTALAAWPNEALSTDRLVDALWGERPPRSSSKVLQNVVLRLRKHLGGSLIETRPGGYALRASDVDIDARRFELLVREGRAHAQDRDLVAASAELAAAVDLWRGPPLPELCDWPPGRSEAARLEELHRCVTEELAELELACGHHHQWIPVLESLVSEEPLRERRWALLMVALYRCGRQADALRAYQRARVALDDVGLEPGPELVNLEQRVGARDKSLEHESPSLVVPVPTGDAVLEKGTEVVRPSGTVTFLFTDLEGSTPLWDAHPAVMQDALARHDEILRSAIAAHGGFIFSTGGDGLGAAFQRSIDAVRAAVDAQRALQAEPWPDTVELRVRMGAHTGEAQERDGNYFGSAVNRAARVAGAGHGGQILLSRATVEVLGPQRRHRLSRPREPIASRG